MREPVELDLGDLPRPPLFKLVDASGEEVFEVAEVGGQPATVGALFGSPELAEEFSAGAGDYRMPSFAGLVARELGDWEAAKDYALSGEDYVLVVSEKGAGLFHAGDVAGRITELATQTPFPLYVIADERGEAPLVSVEDGSGTLSVAPLFSSPERARIFREHAEHLGLPDKLATIEDAEGLRRHALVARQAGAGYAVVDPERGEAEAIPVEDLIQPPGG